MITYLPCIIWLQIAQVLFLAVAIAEQNWDIYDGQPYYNLKPYHELQPYYHPDHHEKPQSSAQPKEDELYSRKRRAAYINLIDQQFEAPAVYRVVETFSPDTPEIFANEFDRAPPVAYNDYLRNHRETRAAEIEAHPVSRAIYIHEKRPEQDLATADEPAFAPAYVPTKGYYQTYYRQKRSADASPDVVLHYGMKPFDETPTFEAPAAAPVVYNDYYQTYFGQRSEPDRKKRDITHYEYPPHTYNVDESQYPPIYLGK